VEEVVDGDTIRVSLDGQIYSLRYIGIDTPETKDPNDPVECYGQEAYLANRDLINGQTVQLEKDVSDTDRYGRLLRYVWIGDEMVNEILVREGYAVSSTYPPDVKHQEVFVAAQQSAREASRGLWAGCGGPDVPVTSPTPVDSISQSNCDPSYRDVCIPSSPPDLDCGQITYRRFPVNPPDPHGFDGDFDGVGCESGQ
jgi:micrococcal nuclease